MFCRTKITCPCLWNFQIEKSCLEGTVTLRPVSLGKSVRLSILRDPCLAPLKQLGDQDFVTPMFPTFLVDGNVTVTHSEGGVAKVQLSKSLMEMKLGFWIRLKKLSDDKTNVVVREVLFMSDDDA